MAEKKRMASIGKRITQLRNLIAENPDMFQDDVIKALKFNSVSTLYSHLSGLDDDPSLCKNNEFRILNKDGKHLTVDDINEYLSNNPTKENNNPKLVERLLYLYCSLHNAGPDGGLTFDAITNIYTNLYMDNGVDVPGSEALKRMIYRDLQEFEKLHIGIERPETGSRKYCLKDRYLPKLRLESAQAVYASMLLYKNTLLDRSTIVAKEEIEKSFFKDYPDRAKALKERIFVVGDTLSNPEEFGSILDELIRAVGESFKIKIGYINNQGDKSDRILEPLGLVYKRNVWYLIARKAGNIDNRTYRVDQIMNLIVRDSENFAYPQDFSLAELIGRSWGVFNNDDVQVVKLKFSNKVAHRVKNLNYHPSQRIIEECSDGSVMLEFQVCGLVEMQGWILQWGSEVEVLEPLSLKEDIINSATSIFELYEANSEKNRKRKN